MYQLYYYPLSASMAPHFLLETLNVNYHLELVDRKADAQKSAAYLALNPLGRIPTLVHDGQVLFESAAICIYLAENHPETNLIPAIGDTARGEFFQWMMFLTNTLQSQFMSYFYPQRQTTEQANCDAIVAAQDLLIVESFALLDSTLAHREYLIGEELSACDFYLFMLCVWGDEVTKPPLAFEHLGRFLKKMATHQAIKTVCKKEGLSLDDYA